VGSLLRPPKLRTGEGLEQDERHATWTELFFDLVFVAAIAELGSVLRDDASLDGILRMAALFVPVWWVWIGYTLYADRFDSDDAVFRGLMFAGMLGSGALAINVHYVAEGSSAGFALSYVAVRIVLLLLYDRARRHVPQARPLVVRYMRGFSVSVALWLISLAFQGAARYAIWALAMTIDIGTPVTMPARIFRLLPIHQSHLPERFGLFILIVLGETVVSVTAASAGIDWTLSAAIVAGCAFAAVTCLWWIYFDLLDLAAIRGASFYTFQVYFYGHLPLLIGLTGVGAGTKLAIAAATGDSLDAGVRATLLGGAALSLALLGVVEGVAKRTLRDRAPLGRGAAALALVVLALAGGGLAPVLVLALLAAILASELAWELMAPAPAETHRAPRFGGELSDPERA
jgi:low temperature requirement protein LtrA